MTILQHFKQTPAARVWDGHLKVDVVDVEAVNADMPPFEREVVRRKEAVTVIPVYHDDTGSLWVALIEQYRPAIDQWILELPAGQIDKGETPEQAGRRELAEEMAGFTLMPLEHIMSYYSAVGHCDEKIHIYLAEQTFFTNRDNEKSEDEERFLVQKSFLVSHLRQLLDEGVFVDAKTIIGLEALLRK